MQCLVPDIDVLGSLRNARGRVVLLPGSKLVLCQHAPDPRLVKKKKASNKVVLWARRASLLEKKQNKTKC